eukprot:NODE_5090_length_1809_cov_13.590369.p2 GENE.NODE_5090_length_1809_cov_13.590369~~NODE_5090_length_1809_cov_13.590369.p2  ORF type:complete len:255 (+),score=59.88 NODE_5090_length_1809_cov_13.590369:867-1631(+)
MSWTGFFIDGKASPARVMLAVIPVLTMLNHINTVSKLTPRLSYYMVLDVFLLICLFFCFGAVVEYAVLHHLLRREAVCERRLVILRAIAQELAEGEGMQGVVEDLMLLGSQGVVGKQQVSSTDANFRNSLSMLQREVLFSEMALLFNLNSKDTISITREMLHKILRRYCCYYTPLQVAELFMRMDIPNAEDMSLMMFLSFLHKFPKPTPVMRQFADTAPSQRLDIILRVGFPISFSLAMCGLFIHWGVNIYPDS